MKIKEFIKKIIKQEKYNSESYIKFLRKKGVSIGDNCLILSPTKTEIDATNPSMLEIGDNVKIATGVQILTHDFSWCVTSKIDGIITGGIGKVIIGNNVFIGVNSVITKNVKIGDNVIIGAGSVVTHDCEPNSVYTGIPAKKIMTIDEFHQKRKQKQLEEAKDLAVTYYKKTNKLPDKQILREYIFLFENRDNFSDPIVKKVLNDSGHYQNCLDSFIRTKPEFNDIEEFLNYCGITHEINEKE